MSSVTGIYVDMMEDKDAVPVRRPVIGRGAELEIVVEHVRANGQVLVTGEPGIGKSTLLDAAVRRFRDDGFTVFRVAGTAALVEHPLAALGHLIGDPGDRTGPALASYATERLQKLARGSQAVIVVDDAHALDPWSLHVIAQVRRRRATIGARGAPGSGPVRRHCVVRSPSWPLARDAASVAGRDR